jgi:hypothetical protein
MERTILPYDETDEGTEFVTEADWIPDFWNFLLGLDRNDLIAELVQNDLDQQAVRTVISFEQACLICEGDGNPIDEAGWRRLRMIRGAGNNVPAKQGKIGVKNHGLKTAFTIGDEIQLLSDGHSITQTLYARGQDKPPYPGASAEPRPNIDAPINGCRVVIRYRDKDLEPREGEAIVLGAIGMEDIDRLFKSAYVSIPEQFAGIVSPEVAPRYEIVLRHWRLGDAYFQFSCTQPRTTGKNIQTFRRRCEVSGSADFLPTGLEEEAARRLLPLKGRLKERVPDFFRRGNRFFVEVSWSINRRGKPQNGIGRFRYPIGYPQTAHEARTGHGIFFNAPFVSDTERHGPARNEITNEDMYGACKALLVDVIARRVVPKWGPDALSPLIPPPGSNNQDEVIRPLLAALASRDAIPTMVWKNAVHFLFRGKNLKGLFAPGNIGRLQNGHAHRKYRFVVPAVTWDCTSIHKSLAMICPSQEKQLDPRIDPEIIRLLADRNTAGFCEVFVTFDEGDAVSRATGEGNQFFAASNNRKVEFANPLIARSYLDVIKDTIDEEALESRSESELRAALLMPDMRGEAIPLEDLYSSAPLPSGIPGLHLPPLLHQEVVSHPLFRRPKWHRQKYTMADFLESGTLQEADKETRKLFWGWLRHNEARIRPRERIQLASIAIWPDTKKDLYELAELCEPRSRGITTVLGDSIHRPHEEVCRSRITALGKNRQTSIRRVPTSDELSNWFNRRVANFIIGDLASTDTVVALDRFEADLAILMRNKGTRSTLKAMNIALPALAQDRSIQSWANLVISNKAINRLALPKRFILRNNRLSRVLNRIMPAISGPTVAMLLSAFEEDNKNIRALQPRLHLFLALTKPEDEYRRQVAGMAILPIDDQPQAPRDLAFIGQKGDFWGSWKIRVSGKGLSQDDQRRYIVVGVKPAVPNQEESQAFFEWLSAQNEDVLKDHISCVLRHILHQSGPSSWAENYTGIPFIPARNLHGVRLVSLRTARHQPVYLPDVREIADHVIDSDPGVHIVIDRVLEITEPISDTLRKLGIRSLREAIGEPNCVLGDGDIQEASGELLDRLKALRSQKVRRTLLKRLVELGVEPDLVRRDWYDRVSRISIIRFAKDVEARYYFRRTHYHMPVDAGFDPVSGAFWIKEGKRDPLSRFCEAVAAQLVFKSTARPIEQLALERALELEIRDTTFGRPHHSAMDRQEEERFDDYEERASEVVDSELGEATLGHSPFKPDPSRNIPKPQPIKSNSGTQSGRRGNQRNPGRQHKDSVTDGLTLKLEKEHIEDLKTKHYTSHCQICLCERSPAELAPKGSYVEWEEIRRRIVDAHHLDLKSGGGARHAGNLILLCKLHHDNYGRRLTREAVTTALRETTREKIIRFGDNNLSNVNGRVAELVIPDTGERVCMFFTHDHVDFWLGKASG